MQTVTLSAHVKGRTIQLDEPFDLPSDAKLLVTILPADAIDAERLNWLAASKAGLARAYADDEPEYSVNLLRPSSPT